MWKAFLAGAILCAPVGELRAQHALVVQKLTELNQATPPLSSDELKSELRRLAATLYDKTESCVGSDIAIAGVQPATADRYVFAATLSGQLRNGWFVTARLQGCDTAPVRFLVMRDNSDQLTTIRVNRGISYAWDSLIGDTLPLARLAAAAALKREGTDCADSARGALQEARIASRGADLGTDVFGARYTGSWAEVWPIKMCDRTIEVTVEFTTDGDGGAYTNIPGDRISS